MTYASPPLYKAFLTLTACLALVAASGCAADIDQRGYIFDPQEIESIQVGTTSRQDIAALLGSPSTLAVTGNDAWYYVGSNVERYAFYNPEILDRQVVVIRFTEDDIVAGVDHYSLEDGIEVEFVQAETPSRGRNISIFEEIFGNIGRFTPAGVGP